MRFVSEGPGTVTAQVVDSTAGPVRLCLQTSAQPERCARLGAGGALNRTVAGTGKVAWVASVINLTPGQAPSVRLKLSFHSNAPSVTLSRFPFLGTGNPGYNGIDVRFAVAEGTVNAAGTWDGNPRPWSATLLDQASGERIGGSTGTGNRANLRVTVGKGIVHLTIENTQDAVTDARVFLQTVVSWP